MFIYLHFSVLSNVFVSGMSSCVQAISDEILVIILAGKKSIQFFTNEKIIGSQTVRVHLCNTLYTYDSIHLFTSTSKQITFNYNWS